MYLVDGADGVLRRLDILDRAALAIAAWSRSLIAEAYRERQRSSPSCRCRSWTLDACRVDALRTTPGTRWTPVRKTRSRRPTRTVPTENPDMVALVPVHYFLRFSISESQGWEKNEQRNLRAT